MKLRDCLILLVLFIVPVIFLKATKDVVAAGSWQDAYAYQLQIIKFSGSGSPENVGKPILIYHPDLFQEVKNVRYPATNLPSGEDIYKKKYELTQMIDPKDKSNKYTYADVDFDMYVKGVSTNPNLGQDHLYDSDGNIIIEYRKGIYFEDSNRDSDGHTDDSKCGGFAMPTGDREKYGNFWTFDKPQSIGKPGYRYYTFRYMSTDRTVTYRTKDIDTSQYYKIYEDSNLTENNVKNNDYLYQGAKAKYYANLSVIQEKFGVTLLPQDADKYYIQIEPVVRILETDRSKFTPNGTYEVKTLEWVQQEPDEIATGKGGCTGKQCVYYVPHWSDGDTCGYDDCYCRDVRTYDVVDDIKSKSSCTRQGYTWNAKERECRNYYTYEKCDKCARTCYTLEGRENECVFIGNDDIYVKGMNCSVFHIDCGVKQRHIIYGMYAYGPSYLRTARAAGSAGVGKLNRAINTCEKNKHCVLDEKTQLCLTDEYGDVDEYEYYIGPNKEGALVGSSTPSMNSKRYYLQGSCTSGHQVETGILHIYLIGSPDPGKDPTPDPVVKCSDICSSVKNQYGQSSDQFLTCAENYCDANVDYDLEGNARKRKEKCIKKCGYVFKDDTSCTKANPYSRDDDRYTGGTSKCNVGGRYNGPMEDTKATYVSCEQDTLNTGDDTRDTIFDQRTYVSEACKETSSFDFTDVSSLSIFAGAGIDYVAKLEGVKECTIFFNTNQWKFDYATVPSRDPVRRNRLLYLYTVFNNALDDSYTPNASNNPYFDPDFLAEGYGEIDWSKYKYDKSKVSVMSKVTEIVENKEKTNSTQSLKNTKLEEKDDQEVYFKDNNERNNSIITLIHNNKIEYQKVNKYRSSSKVEAKYQFDKACIKTDGSSEVYKPTGDVCYTKADGTKELALNKYYTNLKATPNAYFNETIKKAGKTHNVQTVATVGQSGAGTGLYYENTEKCEYEIISNTTTNDNSLSCTILVYVNGGTEMMGNDVYKGSAGITAKVYGSDLEDPEDKINGLDIRVNGVSKGSSETTVTVEKSQDGRQDFTISGVVTTAKGLQANCSREVVIIQETGCNASCTISKAPGKAENLYVVNTSPPVVNKCEAYLNTNTGSPRIVARSLTKNDEKYYVRLNELQNNSENSGEKYNTLYAEVYGSNCSNTCSIDIGTDPPGDRPNCSKEFEGISSHTGEIKEFCKKYYKEDINNYTSVEDCVLRCPNETNLPNCPIDPREREDEQKVKTFCTANYLKVGYYDFESCMNECYHNPNTSKTSYIFRPVNVIDPFPNSAESITPGKRIIGKNWYGGMSKYITTDGEDLTTVAGPNANQNVEYIIELTPSTVRKIREDSSKYGDGAYTDYIRSSNGNADVVGEYKSKFIEEDFDEIFKDSITSGGRIVTALGH